MSARTYFSTLTPFTVFLLFACGSSYSQQVQRTCGDTTDVSGRRVVVYSLSQTEIDSLKGAEADGMNEVLSDFQLYYPPVARWSETVNLQISFEVTPVIRFRLSDGSTWVFDRRKQLVSIGIILTDGVRQPKHLPGVDTDSSWIQQIKEYYGLR